MRYCSVDVSSSAGNSLSFHHYLQPSFLSYNTSCNMVIRSLDQPACRNIFDRELSCWKFFQVIPTLLRLHSSTEQYQDLPEIWSILPSSYTFVVVFVREIKQALEKDEVLLRHCILDVNASVFIIITSAVVHILMSWLFLPPTKAPTTSRMEMAAHPMMYLVFLALVLSSGLCPSETNIGLRMVWLVMLPSRSFWGTGTIQSVCAYSLMWLDREEEKNCETNDTCCFVHC